MFRDLVLSALLLAPAVVVSAAEPLIREQARTPSARLSLPGATPSGLLLPGPTAFAAAPEATAGGSHAIIDDWTLAGKEYGLAIAGQAVAGALGFYIGSGIETAIVGDSHAHKGFLSFTGIRYDNFKGAFWGAATGGLFGSALTTYFVGQTDEEDGSVFWTLVGTGLAGAGACYLATEMDVEKHRDWKPFMPLLLLPSVGGTIGFNVSRWFSDRKRESVVGPDASLHWQPPRVALGGDGFALQALNLSF